MSKMYFDERGSFIVKENQIKKWLLKPHPFSYPSLAITLLLYLFLISPFGCSIRMWIIGQGIGHDYAYLALGALLLNQPIMTLYALFTIIGTRTKKCFLYPFPMQRYDSEEENEMYRARFIRDGFKEEPLTYKNVFKFFRKGVLVTLRVFFWEMWIKLFIAIRDHLPCPIWV